MYTAEYWSPSSEAVHLSANNTVQRASTQSRSIPFHTVVTGSLHKSFQNTLAINKLVTKMAQAHSTNPVFTYIETRDAQVHYTNNFKTHLL
jgi:hypothetical protein